MITERDRHLGRGLKRVWDLYEAADEDLRAAHDLLSAWRRDKKHVAPSHSDSFAFLVRILARTFFVAVEAMNSAFAESLLEFDKQGVVSLPEGERSILEEKSYALSGGKVRERRGSNPFLENCRFRYSRFLEAYGVELGLELGDQGWESFQEALKVRHSITHPKTVSDFRVSRENVKHLQEAIKWFKDQITALFDSCHEILEQPPGRGG